MDLFIAWRVAERFFAEFFDFLYDNTLRCYLVFASFFTSHFMCCFFSPFMHILLITRRGHGQNCKCHCGREAHKLLGEAKRICYHKGDRHIEGGDTEKEIDKFT